MDKKKVIDFLKSIYAIRLLFIILIFSSISYDRFSDDLEKLGSLILAGFLAIALAITYINNKE